MNVETYCHSACAIVVSGCQKELTSGRVQEGLPASLDIIIDLGKSESLQMTKSIYGYESQINELMLIMFEESNGRKMVIDLTGKRVFTLDITDPEAGLQLGEYSVSSVYVAIDESLGVTAGSQATVFAVVAPGTTRGEELYFSIDTDSHYVEFAALSKCNFTAGHYYTLMLNSTTIGAGWHYDVD